MSLTGIAPTLGTPSDLRELVLGAGSGSGASNERAVYIFGNRTSSGDATLDTVSDAIADEADAIAKAGRRSELFWMWKMFTLADKTAKIRFVPITESGGAVATRTITFAGGNATATGTWKIELHGETIEVAVAEGDTAIAQCGNVVDAITAASEGTWQVTAAQGALANDHIATLSTAHKGPRNILILDRLRVTAVGSFGTTATLGATGGGTTEDDASAAITAASNGEAFYWVLPFGHLTSAPTSTDNQLGEAIAAVIQQALPINGKEQTVIFGFCGTQAQATTVATAAGCNTIHATMIRAENNDWTPGMIAAHHAGIIRAAQIEHPSANLAGYTSTDSTIYRIPPPFTITDRPTSTEIEADINNGISPVKWSATGAPIWVRHVTTRSLNASGQNDYKAREGHIYSAIAHAWTEFKGRLFAIKQKNRGVSDRLAKGAVPIAQTLTPDAVEAVMKSVIEDYTSSNPLGLYDGPILDPGSKAAQKASAVATKIPAGISIEADLRAIEHLLFTRTKIREVGSAY